MWSRVTGGQVVCLTLVVVLALTTRVRAQTADGSVCQSELRQVGALEHSLRTCVANEANEHELRQRCEDRLNTEEQKLVECNTAAQSCHNARDGLCEGIHELAQSVLDGRAPPAVDACFSAAQQTKLAPLVAGWSRTHSGLTELLEFASGGRDALPHAPVAPQTATEKTLAQLLQGGGQAPLFYRRLLIGALQRVAPRFWHRLRAAGTWTIDEWFASRARLDEALVGEARGGAEAPASQPGFAGPPLAAALRFVQSYLDLAGCPQLPQSRDCARARQLQELLESSGPLIVQRREQFIWASDCHTLTKETVLDWLQDFPAPEQRPVHDAEWTQLTTTAHLKLYTCFLDDRTARGSFLSWVGSRLPDPAKLTGPVLAHLEQIRRYWVAGGGEDLCAAAVRSLQNLPVPRTCALPTATTESLRTWLGRKDSLEKGVPAAALTACTTLLGELWRGRAASIAPSFSRPPMPSELVRSEPNSTSMRTLRRRCQQRIGVPERFPADVRELSVLAAAWGEDPAADPWWVVQGEPVEQTHFGHAQRFGVWARHLVARTSACQELGITSARCDTCATIPLGEAYDCALIRRVELRWETWRRLLGGVVALAMLGAVIVLWLVRLLGAWRRFGAWTQLVRTHLQGIAVSAHFDPFRWLVPSRVPLLSIELPSEPAWERWGRRASVVRADGGAYVTEQDVNRAAAVARARGAEFALLVHDEGVAPDLAAVRAMLEWAARGSSRAVQILPISLDRLKWVRGPEDLLDLVEQTSLRGNPFELRGRITSASQFFNRERLVSGLLAGIQAGQWLVVGGLRRFGKSSLALEVARRLPGPAAYVDLAGFYHEIACQGDPARAADAIIRYLSMRLHESAQARYRSDTPLPPPLGAEGPLSSIQIVDWFRAFAAACTRAEGQRAPSVLIILDELEQAIGVGPERLAHALDVLSILLGRLRTATGDPPLAPSGARTGVLLCGALHPVMWAPLPALAGQSIMGAFQSVFVPRLSEEAALAMMRGLGARQGIRFTDPALQLIVREAQGIPLLVRRIGSSVLDLYDPVRARQGSLGAVEIGIEGATAAVRREEDDGSPLRVWVESEIGDPQGPAGALLRLLAREGRVEAATLRRRAAELIMQQFIATGIDRLLDAKECQRRAEEAGGVVLRMLHDIKLLIPEGGLTDPDAYEFPDSLVRRILASRRDGSPFSL